MFKETLWKRKVEENGGGKDERKGVVNENLLGR